MAIESENIRDLFNSWFSEFMKEMGRRVRMFSFYFLHRADKIEGCRHSSNPPPFEKGGVFLGYQKWRGVSRIWKLRGTFSVQAT